MSDCGIVGVVSDTQNVAEIARLGLLTLQHRGQESAGLVGWDGSAYWDKRGMGLVDFVFRYAPLALPGKSVIGHVRYSTAGESNERNIQPISSTFREEIFWIAHNGNLVNADSLHRACEEKGYFFSTSTDTEVIAALIHFSSKTNFVDALRDTLRQVVGTYSLVVLYKDRVYAVRDETANLPLAIGQHEDFFLIASESVTCEVLRAKFLREVGPGEIVEIRRNPAALSFSEISTPVYQLEQRRKPCLFEFVYFSRPDSLLEGRRIRIARKRMGQRLWREAPVAADCVVPVSDSGNDAALGVAQESGLPFVPSLLRSHYTGRTFTNPRDEDRLRDLNIKFNPIPEEIQGERIVVVDDSIVRANVSKKVVRLLREAGALEIHFRVSSAPYLWGCYYGKDTARIKGELIARRHSGDVEAIRKEIGVDTLAYLSLDGLKEAVVESGKPGLRPENFCDACFTGEYHIGADIIKNMIK